MKYLSLFIKLVVLVNLISGYFGDLFDLDELKDKKKEQGINNFEKELKKDLEEMVKIIRPSPPTHLKRFPTIRIIRATPIHIQRLGDINKPDDIFEETNFLGPEISTKRIILRKRRSHNFPMLLGPFHGPIPINLDLMPMVNIKNIKKEKEKELEKEIENKLIPHSTFIERKQDVKTNDRFDALDKALEQKLEDFVFGNNAHHRENSNSDSHNSLFSKLGFNSPPPTPEKFKQEKDSLINDKFLPALVSQTINSSNKPNGVNSDIDVLIKKKFNENERIKQVDKPEIKLNYTNTQPERKVLVPHNSTIENNKSDMEKLEAIELSKNNSTETDSILNFMMKTINTSEKRNIYISISIVMLLLVLILVILCNYLSANKSTRRNNKESKFLDEINNNTYF